MLLRNWFIINFFLEIITLWLILFKEKTLKLRHGSNLIIQTIFWIWITRVIRLSMIKYSNIHKIIKKYKGILIIYPPCMKIQSILQINWLCIHSLNLNPFHLIFHEFLNQKIKLFKWVNNFLTQFTKICM